MNSYNENMRSTVAALLEEQRFYLDKLINASNAGNYSSYYACGATIMKQTECDALKKNVLVKKEVKGQVLKNTNASINLLAAAASANTSIKQSVSTTAIVAANIQAASNAILQVAGDIGSIYNILNAAGIGNDILSEATACRQLIDETALLAEKNSANAMDISMLISRLAITALQDKCKNELDLMNKLFVTVSAELEKARDELSVADNQLESLLSKETLARDVVKESNAEKISAHSSYVLANKELNFNLHAFPIKGKESSNLTCSFNLFKSPFDYAGTAPHYPVQDYYLFLVKESQKTFFSAVDAEVLLQNDQQRFVSVTAFLDKNNMQEHFTTELDLSSITDSTGKKYILHDTDGDEIKNGIAYVVFLFASFYGDYKDQLNDFDNFLSAPSQSFILYTQLAAAEFTDEGKAITTTPISFHVTEDPSYAVEYRCIFLPANKPVAVEKAGIAFHFDLNIALNTSAANYTIAKRSSSPVVTTGKLAATEWSIDIREDTTDNFGDLLSKGCQYLPVIVSVSTVVEAELPSFRNAWTGYENSPVLTYQ